MNAMNRDFRKNVVRKRGICAVSVSGVGVGKSTDVSGVPQYTHWFLGLPVEKTKFLADKPTGRRVTLERCVLCVQRSGGERNHFLAAHRKSRYKLVRLQALSTYPKDER
jgi:hypothetical protein